MAVGDEAAAAGLAVVPTTEPVNNGAYRLNQRGDELARVMARTGKVEKLALDPPMFSVQRSSSGQTIPHNRWVQLAASAFATPVINSGFARWTTAALTITKPGVYQVGAHLQVYGRPLTTVGVQLVKNSYPGGDLAETRVDTLDMLAKDEWGGPGGSIAAATATAYNVVRLVAGDVIRAFALQRNNDGANVSSGNVPGDLTMSLIWVND